MLESAGCGCKFFNTYCLFKMACIYYSDKYLNINYFIFHISEKKFLVLCYWQVP